MILGSRWGFFCREELVEGLDLNEFARGRLRDGVFVLAPPFVELTLADGLWACVNAELGTLFDFAEDETIPPDMGTRLATTLTKFASDHYIGKVGNVRRQIGTQQGQSVFAEVPFSVISDTVGALCSFISDEAIAGHTLVGAM